MPTSELKQKTARSIKWNTIDRVSTQILYAVVGIVLANILSKRDFGLVGILIAFQAFANLFVDSGFGTALLQKKDPHERDYSTVFWFNLTVSVVIYAILFFCAPLIAHAFHDEMELIPLSRVLFLTFVLNALSIVQTNRLMKRLDVKQLAVANSLGLAISGVVGVWVALSGGGAWALVWQYVALAAVKTIWLWITGRWWPRGGFHLDALQNIWRVGLSVFSSSLLNTICLQIYSFVIGAINLVSLGIYTQADKWSKMPSASISQILTATFVPVLSSAQDDVERFHRYVARINRFSAFLLFPVMAGLALIGTPLFHTLFGNKWDAAIALFQILTIRGIFIVLISLYNNFILSIGKAKLLFAVEIVKDAMIFAAILATIWSGNLTLIVWGQFAASFVTYFIVLFMASRAIGYRVGRMLADLIPGFGLTLAMSAACIPLLYLPIPAWLMMGAIILTGAIVYIAIARISCLPELSEAAAYLKGKWAVDC